MNKLDNNPTMPRLPQPAQQDKVTSLTILSFLMELIAHSETKGELIKQSAKINKPLLTMALAMIDAQTYENARPHLLDLLQQMKDNPDILKALDGVINA